jgi:butyrate response factor 1
MTTEYYQIPSQQGLLPLDSADPDPWLAAATNALSLSDWSVKGKIHSPPSLFEPDDAEAVSWKHVVPMHTAGTGKPEVKAPKTPKQFNSTASKIDAWSVVDSAVIAKQKKQTKQPQPHIPQLPQLSQLPQIPQLAQLSPLPQQPQLPKPTTPSIADDGKPIEDELAHQNRYKTELCKSFTETGNCRYGVKCQFAHGKEEIRPILRHPKYKTEICKTFHTTGTCPYGIRCRFIHTKSKEESILTVMKAQAQAQTEEEEEDADDDDVDGSSITPPPGIPVPQWSKSWTMTLASAMPSKNIRISDLAEPEPAF